MIKGHRSSDLAAHDQQDAPRNCALAVSKLCQLAMMKKMVCHGSALITKHFAPSISHNQGFDSISMMKPFGLIVLLRTGKLPSVNCWPSLSVTLTCTISKSMAPITVTTKVYHRHLHLSRPTCLHLTAGLGIMLPRQPASPFKQAIRRKIRPGKPYKGRAIMNQQS